MAFANVMTYQKPIRTKVPMFPYTALITDIAFGFSTFSSAGGARVEFRKNVSRVLRGVYTFF